MLVPSQLHDVLVKFFLNRPELAPTLLSEALGVVVPHNTEARIESADLTDVLPAEYRADVVILLVDGKPVLGIVVEVQLGYDERKRFSWPCRGPSCSVRMPLLLTGSHRRQSDGARGV